MTLLFNIVIYYTNIGIYHLNMLLLMIVTLLHNML